MTINKFNKKKSLKLAVYKFKNNFLEHLLIFNKCILAKRLFIYLNLIRVQNNIVSEFIFEMHV